MSGAIESTLDLSVKAEAGTVGGEAGPGGAENRGANHIAFSEKSASVSKKTGPHLEPDLAESHRRAMRRLAATVTIITIKSEIGNLAMVATAVSSLSMAPPSILACVNQAASIYSYLQPEARFAVNFLGAVHHRVALQCAGAASHQDRFAAGRWLSHNGVPYLADAQATLFSRVDELIAYGSHGIIIGKVFDVLISGDPDPLIYVDGIYGRVTSIEQ